MPIFVDPVHLPPPEKIYPTKICSFDNCEMLVVIIWLCILVFFQGILYAETCFIGRGPVPVVAECEGNMEVRS